MYFNDPRLMHSLHKLRVNDNLQRTKHLWALRQASARRRSILDRLILTTGEFLIAFGSKLKYHVDSRTCNKGLKNMGAKA
jgi:hypothetical protein